LSEHPSVIEQLLASRGCETPEQIRASELDRPPDDPSAAIEWMNAKHFVVRESGKTVVITEEFDPELRRRVLKRSSFEDVRKFYCNRRVVLGWDEAGKPKKAILGNYWLNHERRRQYEGIVCAPNSDPPGYYNLWQGFSVEPRQGDWSLMDTHIRENICSGDGDQYRYVRGWLAFAVQHPDTLPEVALVMRGKEGTGKGVAAREFGSLFGQHFLHLARKRNLVGNFNAHLRDAIVVFADEAFLADDQEAENVLKAMITEPEQNIERKFQDVVTTKNLIHLMVASNSDRIINASAEARRFCVLDVSDAHMQDHEYFAAIAKQMAEGGREAMLYDLLHEDLSDFNPRKFPVTAALEDQKVRSMSGVEKWWFDKLRRGRLLGQHVDWQLEILRDDLLKDYRIAMGNRRDEAQDLRNHLAKLLPSPYPRPGPRVSVNGERKRTWVLPMLADCRAHFAAMFRMSNDWPEDDE